MAKTTAQTDSTDTTPPDSEEVKALKELKTISDLKKTIAENEKAERTAKLDGLKSPLTLDPVKSNTSVTGVHIENEILAQKAVDNTMEKLVQSIFTSDVVSSNSKSLQNVIIYNETIKAQIIAYQELKLDLKDFKTRFEREYIKLKAIANIPLDPNAKSIDLAGFTATLVGVYSLIQTIGALKSAFNVDQSFTVTENEISQVSIAASLFKAVNKKFSGVNIISPVHIPVILNGNSGDLSMAWKNITDTHTKFVELSEKVKKLEGEAKKAHADEKDAKLKKKRKERLDEISAGLQKILAQISVFDTLTKRLYKVGEDKSSLLASSMQIEAIVTKLNEPNSFILIVEVEASGTAFTKKSWWVNNIKFSGGAHISGLLFNAEGTLVSAAKEHFVFPFYKNDEID
ncbi:hypothetical protein [Aquimarina sp. AU58]|uniref:hypothetical protein n=1 Tax=Aquimarina sp. AU58 TaxID=1874112 RepID=UPI000D6DC721|nr:hypothetical protein [Aquimarina sp. AU58]